MVVKTFDHRETRLSPFLEAPEPLCGVIGLTRLMVFSTDDKQILVLNTVTMNSQIVIGIACIPKQGSSKRSPRDAGPKHKTSIGGLLGVNGDPVVHRRVRGYDNVIGMNSWPVRLHRRSGTTLDVRSMSSSKDATPALLDDGRKSCHILQRMKLSLAGKANTGAGVKAFQGRTRKERNLEKADAMRSL